MEKEDYQQNRMERKIADITGWRRKITYKRGWKSKIVDKTGWKRKITNKIGFEIPELRLPTGVRVISLLQSVKLASRPTQASTIPGDNHQ